jgi:cation diffusion facilitator CzcD-associated flavoprotein CzcO
MGTGQRDLRVVVVGAGMAGILSAIKLREAGLTDLVVYEKADRLGGTWRENTYPGIACDVPSHLYSYSFALNPDWTQSFSPGEEIEAYFERVAHEYGVVDDICFGEEVTACDWADGRWHLETAAGTRDEADVVIAATGVLHHPRYPDIEGLEDFAGACFHSARWDHDVALEGARVGVIGTGSTAVQITGAIVDRVAHLSLFQRTAQWIAPMDNPAYDEETKQAFREDPDRLVGVHESLSAAFEGFSHAVVEADSPAMAAIEQACRENLENSVTDPELRERLRPDYRAGCKRLVLSADFYDAIQQPQAELVTEGIERIEPAGVRTTDGRLHELDVLVLATGFRTDAFMRPMAVTGRGGRTLAEAWADRPVAYLSISIPEFPNLFLLNGPNGPVGNFSLIEVAELQLGYVLQLIDRLRDGTCREISASQAATDDLEEQRLEASRHTIWATGCRSWYLDDRGVPAVWPFRFTRFREEMAAPDLSAYDQA